jgi:hypothetical protein
LPDCIIPEIPAGRCWPHPWSTFSPDAEQNFPFGWFRHCDDARLRKFQKIYGEADSDGTFRTAFGRQREIRQWIAGEFVCSEQKRIPARTRWKMPSGCAPARARAGAPKHDSFS